ncbi:hypothetical protein AMTR_s00097p00156790 [Amborella trichopoda]|uniref:Phytocyanin domain-containing protein n=1 Tax=Amborella trichopoda TaxID=13333 RepID=W1NVV9_AMBTC|nr:hypothetical protein AMTR_s00097p00156790 [Amborella trichopoda]
MDSKFVWAVVSVVIVVMHNMQPAAALTHIVGGSFGWKIPPNNTFYDQWAKTHTFNLNDKLGM